MPPGARSAPAWPQEARELLELACQEHGGFERFGAVQRLELELESLRGALVRAKGLGSTFSMPRRIEVRPADCVTIFRDFPAADQVGIFERGSVRIENAAGGVIEQSPDHRASFGLLSKYRRWRPLDALYFFGYALWHYHTLPFSLASAAFVRLGAARDLQSITVDFDRSVPTHGRRQTFFFDAAYRLVRHDYQAEILGAWARGCHLWSNFSRVQGLLVARGRRVLPHYFGRPLALPILSAELEVVSIDLR